MSVYECPKCGRKIDVDDECCSEAMDREGNKLTCIVCDEEEEIPSCCGGVMVKVAPEEEQQEEKEE